MLSFRILKPHPRAALRLSPPLREGSEWPGLLNSSLITLRSSLKRGHRILHSSLFVYYGVSLFLPFYPFTFLPLKKPLKLALPLHIFFYEEVFAIEHGVGKLRDPVAEDEHAALARELKVQLDVTVTIDEEVDVLMRLHIIFREEYQMLAVLAHVRRLCAILTLQTAVLCP